MKYEPSCQVLVGGDKFPIFCEWYLSRRIKELTWKFQWNWKKGFVPTVAAFMLSELLWTISCDQIRWKVPDSKRNHTHLLFLGQSGVPSPTPSESAKLYANRNRSSSQVRHRSLVVRWLWTINWQMSCLNLSLCSFCIWKLVATNVTESCDQVSRDIAWLESGKKEEKEKAGLTFNDLNISATTNIQHHHPHNWHR